MSDAPGQRLMTEIGTQSYLPPEQVEGRGRNSAGDLWALGVLAYAMLVGGGVRVRVRVGLSRAPTSDGACLGGLGLTAIK